MDRDSLIDTIQRLLALSGSPNEHEAKLALAKAQELMLRHNLSMAEVQAADLHAKEWVEEDAWSGKRSPWEQVFVANIIDKYFFAKCSTLKRRSNGETTLTLRFFGNKENVAVAKHVFVYLSRTFRDLWEGYRRETKSGKGLARTFYHGVWAGFKLKLDIERAVEVATEKSKNALVVISDELASAFADHHPDLKSERCTKVRHDSQAYNAGYRKGQAIKLHSAIEGTSPLAITG